MRQRIYWLFALLLPQTTAFYAPTKIRSLSVQPFKSALQFRDLHPHEETTVSKASRLRDEVSTPINMDMVQTLCSSQLIIFLMSSALAMASVGSPHIETLRWSFQQPSLTPMQHDPVMTTLLGVLATVPMVFLSNKIEFSDSRDASRVNFRTNNLVIQLFGRRSDSPWHSVQVMATSFLLTSMTAVSEEMVFRLFVPVAIMTFTHSLPLAMVGQALLFGVGHFHPQSSLGENRMVVGLQTTNGLVQGGLYLLSGGNILPCILSHFLYDLHVLTETWHQVNEQIDWAERDHRLSTIDKNEIDRLKAEANDQLTPETIGFCRRFFYAFDYEHRGSLSLVDVQRAVAYAFLQDDFIPSESQVKGLFHDLIDRRDQPGEERLRLSEFLRLLFTLRTQSYQKRVASSSFAPA